MKLKDILSGKPLTEAKSAKALRADYDKAVKKEQTLSSLLLVNLEKYKAAKAKGDEKAIAKHTKIAGDIGKKKKKATADASAAYKAYEDKISGLHADAELELKESVLGQMPSDKLMKMKWNPLAEANPDGTISGDEDKEMTELLEDVESRMEDLLYEVEQETRRIGGKFRQPGYKAQVIKLLEQLVNGFAKGDRF